MKLKISTNTSRLALAMLLLGGVASFTGCSTSDKNDTENIAPENLSSVQVNVTTQVMQEEATEVPKLGKASNNATVNTGYSYSGKLEKHAAFDAQVSFGNTSSSVKASANTTANISTPQAAALANGIQYRVLLYNSNGTLAQSKLATSGIPLAIDVVKGATYTWIAYSYNKDASTTLPDIANANNPTISTGENVDFLHDKGTITIPNTPGTITSPLNINFAHKLRRIAVQLNTQGMFADLASGAVTFDVSESGNFFEKGTLDLKTGNIIAGSNTSFTAPIVTAFERTTGYDYNDRNVFYFYTAKTDAINRAKVKINSFSITLDNNATRAFTTASTLDAFDIPAISALGKSQMPNVDLVESAITVNGVQWARANLYYSSANNAHNAYRFHHMNAQNNSENSFWGWRSLTPDGKVGNGDPCLQVYPQNTWKTPTPTEITAGLLSQTATYVLNNPRNINFVGTGTGAPYPHGNTLTLPLNGEGTGLKLLGFLNLIPFSVKEYGKSAQIWSNDPTINVLNLVGIGANFYNGKNGTFGLIFPGPEIQTQNMETSLLGNTNLLGIDVITSGYKNVRCVRK